MEVLVAAPIAQLVERYTCNVKVSCSIHGGSLANEGELAQMVERTLSMREARGSMPRFSKSTFGVVVTYFPSKEVPRFRLPEGAFI